MHETLGKKIKRYRYILKEWIKMRLPKKSEMVFVYGSLKKGMMNHERFGLHTQKFLGTEIVHKFKMYSLHWYPCIVYTGEWSDTVSCEVYLVKEDIIETIRAIEIHAGYTELIIPTHRYKEVRKLGYIYAMLKKPEHARVIQNGVWTEKMEDILK